MIKRWKEIIGLVLLLSFMLFALLHIFVNLYGKTLLTKKLEDVFKRKTEIESLKTSFPATIVIKNIRVNGLFKIDTVLAGGGVFDIFRRNFRLSTLKVINPQVTIERGLLQATAEVAIPASVLNLEKKKESNATTPDINPMAATRGKFLFPYFFINQFAIDNGTFNFIDHSIQGKEITIKIEKVNMKVDNLGFVNFGSPITSFELEGVIPWQKDQTTGAITAEGWFNLRKKDMRASLNIKNIDGIYLHPYYSNWVDLEKSRIQQAKLNFNSEITGHNNDIIADCHLELTDIVFRPKEGEEPEEKAHKIATAVLDLFKAFNGKIDLNFTIRTKMDRPEFGFDNIRMAVEDKIAKTSKQDKLDTILSIPVKLIENTLRGATDITKAMIDGTAAIGKEIKKGAEEIFKKEKEEQK